MTRKSGFHNRSDGCFYFEDVLKKFVEDKFNFSKNFIVHNESSAGALAEFVWGLKRGSISGNTQRLLYLRIDEGVNGGIIHRGVPMESEFREAVLPEHGPHELLPSIRHPEIGHVRPRRHPFDRNFNPLFSGCPSHDDCYEGLASAFRIRKQWGGPNALKSFTLSDLPINHPMWDIESEYIAALVLNCVLVLSPELVIISGLVGGNDRLIDLVRDQFRIQNNGHFVYPGMDDRFIRRGLFGPEVVVVGALQLAQRAAKNEKWKPVLVFPRGE